MGIKILMSADSEAFDTNKKEAYDTTLCLIRRMQHRGHDLLLVYPTDYDLDNPPKIKKVRYINGELVIDSADDGISAYRFLGPAPEISQEDVVPDGDLFLVFGDGEMTGEMDDVVEDQYSFLKSFRDAGTIGRFLNDPDAEERTVKSALIGIDENIPVGITYQLQTMDELEYLLKHNAFLVKKPVFGCKGRGVEKISIDNYQDVDLDNSVFQEVLEGPEKRIILFNKNLMVSRIAHNRKAPWMHGSVVEKKMLYQPTRYKINKSIELMERLGLEIGAVDWIGDKINEVNGSGTGLVGLNEKGEIIYDCTGQLVDYIEEVI